MTDILDLVRVREAARSGRARELRIAARLTCSEIGEACGITVDTVERWEKGLRRPRGDAALRYWKVLLELEAHVGQP